MRLFRGLKLTATPLHRYAMGVGAETRRTRCGTGLYDFVLTAYARG